MRNRKTAIIPFFVYNTRNKKKPPISYFLFLSRVSTLTRDIDIAILSVRPSVCLSVTFRYHMKTV